MELITRENYFQHGTTLETLAVTSSSLQHIHPTQGGSILRFIRYITGTDQKKESLSLDRGSLLHKYLEDAEGFKISPEVKPSEAVCKVVEDVYDTVISSGTIPGVLSLHTQEILTSARKFQYGAAGKWGNDAILKGVREKGDKYFDFLIEASDRIIVDAATKNILTNIMSTFENNEGLRKFIENSDGFSNLVVYKELVILFRYRGLDCKSMMDRVEIDFERKTVYVYDYKSTSEAVRLYMGASILVNDHNGNPYTMGTPGPFQKYHTYRQLAFYQLAIIEYLKQQGYNPAEFKYSHWIVACETVQPFEVMLYPISKLWMQQGLKEVDECFDIIEKNMNLLNPPQNYEY